MRCILGFLVEVGLTSGANPRISSESRRPALSNPGFRPKVSHHMLINPRIWENSYLHSLSNSGKMVERSHPALSNRRILGKRSHPAISIPGIMGEGRDTLRSDPTLAVGFKREMREFWSPLVSGWFSRWTTRRTKENPARVSCRAPGFDRFLSLAGGCFSRIRGG